MNRRKILLIRPYFEMLEHELVFLPFEPLGLQYIQSALLPHGHGVEIYDCPVERPASIRYMKENSLFRCGSEDSRIIKKIRQFKPDIVGISGMFYSQARPFYHVADLVKSVSGEIIVIGGGAFVSSYQKEVLVENKNIDFLVVGEGEETIVDLVNNLCEPDKVRGIWLRRKETGEPVFTGLREPKMNLDEIFPPHRDFSKIYDYSKPVGYNYSNPPSFKKKIKSFILYRALSLPLIRNLFAVLFNFRHRKSLKSFLMPHGFIITSRSCPNHCTFCAIHKVWGNIYRMRSAENVLKEIDSLVKNGAKEIVIVDDNFTVSQKRTIDICKAIIERKYNIRLIAPSGVFVPTLDRETLDYLYKAGFRELLFGIENADQDFLKNVIKKNLDLEQTKKIIKEAKEAGLRTKAFLIFGYPGETKETMLKTLRFAFESGVASARFYIFQPFPGTEAFQTAVEMGALEKNLDLGRLKVMTDTPQIETKDFSRKDVKKIYDLAYKLLEKRNYEEIKDKIPNILGWR
jgi:anaerobic magnesium-protoporphyrin IX monomethyl ester cyclase